MPLVDHHIEVMTLESVASADELTVRRRRMAAERAKQARVKREKLEEAKRIERRAQEDERRQRFLAKAGARDHRRRQGAEAEQNSHQPPGDTAVALETATKESGGGEDGDDNQQEDSTDAADGLPPPPQEPLKRLILTSSWVKLEPLATSGFVVTDLTAETKYKFRVRSVSSAGESLFSDWVHASTTPATAPSQCLFFEQDHDVTLVDDTTSLALRWTVPEDTGGSDIVDYEISFELSVIKAKVTDVAKNMRENRRLRQRTGYLVPAEGTMDESDKRTRFGDRYRGVRWRRECRYIVRGLEGGLTYRNIEVRAVNRTGFLSKTADSKIASVALRSPPRNEVLLKDYRRCLEEEKEALELKIFNNAEVFGAHYFDSSFYM